MCDGVGVRIRRLGNCEVKGGIYRSCRILGIRVWDGDGEAEEEEAAAAGGGGLRGGDCGSPEVRVVWSCPCADPSAPFGDEHHCCLFFFLPCK